MATPSAIGRVREPRSPQTPNTGAAIMYTSMNAGHSQPACACEIPSARSSSGTSGGTR